jgi:hypothetical protein
MDGTCGGPLLRYANGSTAWLSELTVPFGRKTHERTVQEAVLLPAGSPVGPFEKFEEIQVEVARARGIGGYEVPLTLTLEITLAS